MRKALIGILLAASAATPAFAQDGEPAPQTRYQQRFEQRQQQNQQRFEQRQQRQEQRVQQRQEQAPAQPQEARQQRVEQRQQRQEQGQVAQQQGGGARQERREDRQERRAERRENRGNWGGGQQQGHADGWNNVDPNDQRAVRARDRYERLEDRNQREYRRDRREDRRDWRDDRRAERRWDRRWRNDHRYDWYSYRNSYRDLYRPGRYYDPYGYGYNRFSIGIRIGAPFYSSRYHISDPWRYRLPDAGPGYAWVRYYNDVQLVDTWTGEVVDVIYDFFW